MAPAIRWNFFEMISVTRDVKFFYLDIAQIELVTVNHYVHLVLVRPDAGSCTSSIMFSIAKVGEAFEGYINDSNLFARLYD